METNFDFSCLVSLQSIFLTCMAFSYRVVGGACPVHEEKGVINLTYKAIVSFTAANVHVECPTNVETLTLKRGKLLFVIETASPSSHYPPPFSTHLPRLSISGYESGRGPFLLLTSFKKSHKVFNYKGQHCA